MLRTLAVASLILSTIPLAAQGVVPSRYTTREGSGFSAAPGDSVPMHMQCVYHDAGIQSGATTWRGIRWRRDGSNARYLGHTQTVQLQMSSRGVPAPEHSHDSYRTNRGIDHRVVFTGRVSFPTLAGGSGPHNFSVSVPLSSPFAYSGSGHLLVEVIVRGTTFRSHGWRSDSTPTLSVAPGGTVQNIGLGCPTTFQLTVEGSVPWPGAPLILRSASGAASGRPAIAALGSTQQLFKLDSIGAPGCALHQDVLVQVQARTAAGGLLISDLGRLPPNPWLVGRSVRVQQFVLDPGFNRAGLRASQSVNLTFGKGFPVGLEAHAWYDTRANTIAPYTLADSRTTRTPIIQLY